MAKSKIEKAIKGSIANPEAALSVIKAVDFAESGGGVDPDEFDALKKKVEAASEVDLLYLFAEPEEIVAKINEILNALKS